MELFRLLGTIAIENEDAIKAIKNTTDTAEKSESKLSNAFGKIGGAAVKVGKVVAAGVAVGATAIGALTKSAVDGYADFEQLVGGVETLFGTQGMTMSEYAISVGKSVLEINQEYNRLNAAQELVMRNAENAYKTAGLSANEYMETVTSFSAALIQSLDGDTLKAADAANQAIVDMSDNANKMGSSMESIQNAYQGFAKQNYTMLDNLKLGYGGTKEEMQRLLDDATKLSGVEYDLSSYADIVDAIHVVQTEMGITGTTAKEASTTISGSISSMKSAWQNLVAGLGNEDANLSVLIDNLVDSAMTVTDNVMPRIEVILNKITEAITKIVPKITSKMPTIINSLLPSLINGAIALMNGLVQSMPAIIDALMGALPDLIGGIMQMAFALMEALPQIMDVICSKLPEAIELLCAALPAMIPSLVKGLITMIVTLMTYMPQFIQPIIDYLPDIIEAITTSLLDNLPALVEVGGNLLMGLFEGMLQLVAKIPEILDMIFAAIWEGLVILFDIHSPSRKMAELGEFIILGLINGIQSLIGNISVIWQQMWDSIISILTSAIELVQGWFTTMQEFLTETMNSIWSKIGEIWDSIKLSVSQKVENIVSDVKQKFQDIIDGIKEKMNLAKEAVSEAIEKIKGFFDFEWHLPELKLPHITITGSWDLKNGTFPSFGVEWYAKGAVLNRPTIFGMNGMNAMVGGEAGAEAVAPIDVLQGYVAQAVASQNAGLVESLMKILDALLGMREGMKEDFIEALETMRFELNNREFARLVKAVN